MRQAKNINTFLILPPPLVIVWLQFLIAFFIKGYLCYKKITSQNVPSEALVKKYFCLVEKLCSILEIYMFFFFLIISDAMMSINTRDRVHFKIYLYILKIYLYIHSPLTHQSWSIDRYKQGQYFSEIFWTIWRTGAKFQAFFSLATCSINNYGKFLVFHFLERINKREIKMVNIKYLKLADLVILHFIKIVNEPETSFQSPAWSQKHVRTVCYMTH